LVRIPEFHLETRDGAKIWISRSSSDPAFVDLLGDPDRLLSDPKCLVIKDQKKIKVGRLTVTIGGSPRSVYIKRYDASSLRSALLGKVAQSGALRSLRGAVLLHQAGIPTVTPVAAVENRRYGIIYKSFFIAEEIVSGKTADAYWQENLQHLNGPAGVKRRLAFLRQVAGLFQKLHAQQIYHGDLKDANILVAARCDSRSTELFLLDLDGVRRYTRLGQRRRIKNLVQLYRTLGRSVPPPQRLFFLKCYLGPLFGDRHFKRKLIGRVLRFATQIEEFKARRRWGDNVS
jgi:serine/threonine protein kinase